jgi:tellurite resistance protein
MRKALGKLAEALEAAKADGVLTPDEQARIRDLRAWLKTLGE